MARGLKVSHLLIVNMIVVVNISSFWSDIFSVSLHIMTFSVAYWNTWGDSFCFSMQGESVIEHTNGNTGGVTPPYDL